MDFVAANRIAHNCPMSDLAGASTWVGMRTWYSFAAMSVRAWHQADQAGRSDDVRCSG